MADAVDWALSCSQKPQPALALLAVISAFAAACGGDYRVPDGMRLNLYCIGNVATGGGKDAPQRCASELARLGGTATMGRFGSGEGLEDALKEDRFAGLMVTDEVAHIISAIEGQSTPHILSLYGNLLALYSASKGTYTTRGLANKAGRTVNNPSISWLGFAVPEKLGEALKVSTVSSGLVNRCLFAEGVPGVKPRLLTSASPVPESVQSRLTQIRSHREGATAEDTRVCSRRGRLAMAQAD
jgi:hypothetical protein